MNLNPVEKRICDPVHGIIELTSVERQLVDTPAFQRLRNIKQLGLASLVFPGADYSRFSHSLGACAVAAHVVTTLENQRPGSIAEQGQTYRVAALLHDIGHYPFSHTMEYAIRDVFAARLIRPKADPANEVEGTGADSLGHESVAKRLIVEDHNISGILDAADIPKEEVAGSITGESETPLSKLISASLDVDRSDYLLRTACSTGLPYGHVDLRYLISQYRFDNEDRLCISHKGMRTAEHFLLSRYFDYQQIVYHKTVAAFEWLLRDVLHYLIEHGSLKCSETDVVQMIRDDTWPGFDDAHVWQAIRGAEAAKETPADVRLKARALCERRRPWLVGHIEFFSEADGCSEELFLNYRQTIKSNRPQWARDFGIGASLWHVWSPEPARITKIGSRLFTPDDYTDSETNDEPGAPSQQQRREHGQEIRILDQGGAKSRPIVKCANSLLSVLSNYKLYAIRIYVLVPPDRASDAAAEESLRGEIKTAVRGSIPAANWL